ncbi:MAG: acetate--CoA ligase [Flavobacteriales bacterium]|nr:acetate--CoA ligase [Flavobacteriales bacterium]
MTRIQNTVDYFEAYEAGKLNPEGFWGRYASHEFTWRAPWHNVYSADFEQARFRWFEGAQLNITENCLDRHLHTRGDQIAVIWEPNDPIEEPIKLSYRELYHRVCQTANVLKRLGASKGDRICLYMPMIPELLISVLACARIGAIHSVVFAGFSSRSLADRINDAGCSILITADGSFRGDKIVPLKDIADQALEACNSVRKSIVVKRTETEIQMVEGRDVWWHDLHTGVAEICDAEVMDSEDPLFILYTSGSTGRPKGMVHTCGGYMVYTCYSFEQVFQYRDGEIYWCTADIGWITGHSYIVYGPLLYGATTMLFEGVPSYPDMGRFWQIVDKYEVNIFYTAPTAIRALAQCDPKLIERSSLRSLRVLGTVGEPINLEAWEWYNDVIGKGQCPIVDTWWQTETGGIMISPLAGITHLKPTFATLPLPGIVPVLMDEHGNEIHERIAEGKLCIKQPWPSMARTIYGDHQRFIDTYFAHFPGYYFTGDGARRDLDGFYRITGRVDDVVIVSGHNLGTAEIENALDEHEQVAESAVVGYPHPIKGNAICAFIVMDSNIQAGSTLEQELLDLVSTIIGPIAKPDKFYIVPGLHKTRSGKIMRRILRKLASGDGQDLGDISTLLNPEIVESIGQSMGLTTSA